MHITHITSVHHRFDTRIFFKECTSLAKAGHSVTLVVADGQGDEEKNGVHIIDAGEKPKSRIKRMQQTVEKVVKKSISTNADVFHLHDPELLFKVPVLLKYGKVIYDVHEDVPKQILSKHWIPKFLRRTIAFFSEITENHYAVNLSGIVTSTPFIAKRFEAINRNVANINNYPLREEFSNIETRKSNENYACYIGGISSERGIFEMVKAMELVNGKLILAGTFSTPTERKIAQKLPGWEKVEELGFCDRRKIGEILASARVGLVLFHPAPNHTNAQPNKLFEYMAAGLPVIASDFPLWRDIINSAQCGICEDPFDPIKIADAINWIFENSLAASRMGANGKNAVEEIYNWEKEEKKMLKFYNAVKNVE